MIEIPIGGTIRLEAVAKDGHNDCEGCCLDVTAGGCSLLCSSMACASDARKDGKSVIFKLVNAPEKRDVDLNSPAFDPPGGNRIDDAFMDSLPDDIKQLRKEGGW